MARQPNRTVVVSGLTANSEAGAGQPVVGAVLVMDTAGDLYGITNSSNELVFKLTPVN